MEEWKEGKKFTFHVLRFTLLICLFAFLQIGFASAQNDVATLFIRNHYYKAIAALPKNPSDPETRYLLGLCYFKLGLMYMEIHQAFLPLALDYYGELDALPERIPEEARPSIYTPYYLGLTYLEIGDYERAIAALNRFLDQSPSDDFVAYARCALGGCYYLRQDKEKAEAEFLTVKQLIDKPSVAVCLATTYQRLGIHADMVSQIYERFEASVGVGLNPTPMLDRFHQSLAVIASRQGDHQTALQLTKQVPKNQPDLLDEVDNMQSLEFFHPRRFFDVGEVHLRQAYDLFLNLVGKLPDLDGDLRYANGLILYQLGNYDEAVRTLEPLLNPSENDAILKGGAAILLGGCYHALGQAVKARRVWQSVPNSGEFGYEPILAVELASIKAQAKIELMTSARLVRNALEQIKRATGTEAVTEDVPAFYPPADAFPQREVYRRAGSALLNLSQYAGTEVDTAALGMKAEDRLIDLAVQTYRLGHIISYPYTIDEPPWGNDPALLINMAYASYKRGFTHWGGVVEALGVIQRDYPELYPLHLMVQVIYAIRLGLHNKK